MELFGIGLPEFFFIVVIALIVLGPKDMVKAGRTIGAWLRGIITSPAWRSFLETSREVRELPTKLMREAGLDELRDVGQQVMNDVRDTTRSISTDMNTIAPPRTLPKTTPSPAVESSEEKTEN